ncbi:MAG: hypothetical protein AAFQ89_14935 [Cyanobacteria bacterium J06626_18]
MNEVLNPACRPQGNSTDDLIGDTAQGYYIRGAARLTQRRWADGIADLEIALQKDPDLGFVCWTLGVAYREQGHDLNESLAAFERAAAIFSSQESHQMAKSAQLEASKIRERLAS